MKTSQELFSTLEEIQFKYVRMEALISALQSLIAGGDVEIKGIRPDILGYSLYEIELEMVETNSKLRDIIEKKHRRCRD